MNGVGPGKLLQALNLHPELSEETQNSVVVLNWEVHYVLASLECSHRQCRANLISILQTEYTKGERVATKDVS